MNNTITMMMSWLNDKIAENMTMCGDKTHYINGELNAYELTLFQLKTFAKLNEDEVS